MKKLLGILQAIAGIVTGLAALLLWLNLVTPAQRRALETTQTLEALRNALSQLQPQVARIPETSIVTTKTLSELADSTISIGTQIDHLLGVSETSIDSIKGASSALDTAANGLDLVSNITAYIPGKDALNARNTLYEDATNIREMKKTLDASLLESGRALVKIRPQLRDTLNVTAALLRRYASDLKLMETSVLPTIPPLLEKTSTSVAGLAESVSQVSVALQLLCIALGAVGVAFFCSGVGRQLG